MGDERKIDVKDLYEKLLEGEDEEGIEVDDSNEELDEDQKVIEFMTELVELVEDFYEKLINVHVQQAAGTKEKPIKIKKEWPPVETKPNIVHSKYLRLFADIIPVKVYGKTKYQILQKMALEKPKLKTAFKDKEDVKIEKQNTFFENQYKRAESKA